MYYKTKRRAAEVFRCGVPYRVEAMPFEVGAEDGYRVRIKSNGHMYYIRKGQISDTIRERCDILCNMIYTVFGPVEVSVGDMVIETGDGGKLVMKKEIFEEWYEIDDSTPSQELHL